MTPQLCLHNYRSVDVNKPSSVYIHSDKKQQFVMLRSAIYIGEMVARWLEMLRRPQLLASQP